MSDNLSEVNYKGTKNAESYRKNERFLLFDFE